MSHDGLMVSVSGIRGVVGPELTPEVALRFAAKFGDDPLRVSAGTWMKCTCGSVAGLGTSDESWMPMEWCWILSCKHGGIRRRPKRFWAGEWTVSPRNHG